MRRSLRTKTTFYLPKVTGCERSRMLSIKTCEAWLWTVDGTRAMRHKARTIHMGRCGRCLSVSMAFFCICEFSHNYFAP